MPDALSTTIPIWCTVINLYLLPDHALSANLFLPPSVPSSAHAQISALIPGFLAALVALRLPNSPRGVLTKPLRPFWVTQDSPLVDGEPLATVFDDYRPVICCTASRRIDGSELELDEGGYIQGAGDDTENWACGLTPVVFWQHERKLIDAPEADLPDMIAQFVAQHKAARTGDGDGGVAARMQLTPSLAVCAAHALESTATRPGECCIVITQASTPRETWTAGVGAGGGDCPSYMEAGLGRGKTASRNLRLALGDICTFASRFLAAHPPTRDYDRDPGGQVIVACDSGKDLSVGAALALSCYLFDDEGTRRDPGEATRFTKAMVRARLGSIMTTFPEANPSRATLQSVNSFLMEWPR